MQQHDNIVHYYDTIADKYDEDRFCNSYGQFIDGEERRALNELINTTEYTQRLEIACGTGRLTNYATHALDASEEMMKHAREKHPQVMFRQALATATGFEDSMFDTVYAFHLMMHLEPVMIDEIFTEVHRILKPKGRFIFDFPSQKRRRLLHHKQASWHGGTELSLRSVASMAAHRFRLERSFGIMMLPIHKLPHCMRSSLQRLDYTLANGWMKEYSSYLIVELIKNNDDE